MTSFLPPLGPKPSFSQNRSAVGRTCKMASDLPTVNRGGSNCSKESSDIVVVVVELDSGQRGQSALSNNE